MSHDEKRHDEVAANRSGDARGPSRFAREGAPSDDELRFVERWSDLVDAFVADELDAGAREELLRAASNDPELRAAIDDARASARAFARMPALRAPTSLDARILAAVDAERAHGEHATAEAADGSRPMHRRSNAPRSRRDRAMRWGALAAVAAAVVLMIVTRPASRIDDPNAARVDGALYVAEDGTTYSEAEVRAAAEQVELALAVFGRSMDRTASALREEVTGELRDHVTDPLREGFDRSVNSIPYLRPRPGDQEHSGTSPELHEGERPLRSRALESAHIGERT